MNGILLIDKPAGITSAEVVRRVKRLLPRGAKVGHLGTLDPFATGLLPLCLGEGTKIAQFLNTADKRYRGLIQLGSATDTGDRTGAVVHEAPVGPIDAAALAEVCRRFTGEIRQRPPMYSALKKDGVPLYRLARQGIEVEREERPVRIERLTLELAGPDQLRLEVACSKGTYVRVLAEDIGAALGTVAHLRELRRTGFGDFDIAQAVALDAFDPARPAGLVPLRAAVAHLPAVTLDAQGVRAVRQGKSGVLSRLAGVTAPAAALVDPDGHLAAVAVQERGHWRYGRVLAPAFTA
ncbi:MAG TPA: tRNA pseudouridine(55) synthase TruB [Candidatus Dormibacteraeota bacterium]|nr:tRNA pseudouridine(55) synthase TruB [Candidatus Dormibacteraeota bacterium]